MREHYGSSADDASDLIGSTESLLGERDSLAIRSDDDGDDGDDYDLNPPRWSDNSGEKGDEEDEEEEKEEEEGAE